MTQEPCYVGIDVSKATLDVAVRPQNKTWAITHDEAGISALMADLKARQLTLIVLESAPGVRIARGGCIGYGAIACRRSQSATSP